MARNAWELVDEDEVELDEVEEDEEEDEGEERPTCGDRELSSEDRRRYYADDAADPEELTGFLSWEPLGVVPLTQGRGDDII